MLLTKNGRRRYVMLNIRNYERHEAEQALLAELGYGKRIADEKGALSTVDVKAAFAARFGQPYEPRLVPCHT